MILNRVMLGSEAGVDGQLGKHPHRSRGMEEGLGGLWRGNWETGYHLK